MTLDDLVCSIAKDAGLDTSKLASSQLRSWINQALCKAQEVRPELFAKEILQKATAGRYQRAKCGQVILSIDAIDGKPIIPKDSKLKRIAALLSSCSAGTQAYLDPVILDRFELQPEAKGNENIVLTVSEVAQYQSGQDDACFACAHENLIRAYLEYAIAKVTDQDSAAGQSRINGLLQAFYAQVKAAQSTIYSLRKMAA